MKNKIIAILMASAIAFVTVTACGSSVVNNSDDVIVTTTMFERHMIDKYYSILVNKKTGVCYLEFDSDYRYGITVMLNADGTPKIWEKR